MKKTFYYDNGKLRNSIHKNWNAKKDQEAGSVNNYGYVIVRDEGKLRGAHRVIWELLKGPIPEGMQIDHINRVRDDNRIENLRLVTAQQNQFNRTAKGYFWNKKDQRWHAQIRLNRERIYIGQYKTEDEAKAAYLERKKELHIV